MVCQSAEARMAGLPADAGGLSGAGTWASAHRHPGPGSGQTLTPQFLNLAFTLACLARPPAFTGFWSIAGANPADRGITARCLGERHDERALGRHNEPAFNRNLRSTRAIRSKRAADRSCTPGSHDPWRAQPRARGASTVRAPG